MAQKWTEAELLLAMNVYTKLPFGKLDQRTPLVVRVAEKMSRSPGSVAMKLCNFASFDPELQARGIKGLPGASRADHAMWDAFHADWDEMSARSEAAFEQLMDDESSPSASEEASLPAGDSETERMLKVRRHQKFFRNAVLASYEETCAISLITLPGLLNASHIVPWHVAADRRADPTNGICLNTLYDRAFDRGFITFDKDLRLVVSQVLRSGEIPDLQHKCFCEIEGRRLCLPHRFAPDELAMEYHRSHVFCD